MGMVTMLAVEQNPHEMPGYQTSLRLSRLIENPGHGAKELRGARRGDEDGQAIWIWSDLGFGGLLGGAEIGQGDGDILWLQAELTPRAPVSLGTGLLGRRSGHGDARRRRDGGTGEVRLHGGDHEEIPFLLCEVDRAQQRERTFVGWFGAEHLPMAVARD